MPTSRVWTIGHSTRTADEFVSLLRSQGIDRLADIRTIPQSRRHPHFGRDALSARLGGESIQYRHFKDLGGLRKPRADSANGAWKNQAFRGYADHMETPEFAVAVDELLAFGDGGRVAVMCAEAVWWRCHRRIIADYLLLHGRSVIHLMAHGRSEAARMTPAAEEERDGRLVYPAPVSTC
jgi:uncharacterized protein (DUF488 family)